jgi:hypothetical protein
VIQPSSPAALRNREPIADILADELPESGLVLEIASGGGEHASWFAERFPALEWQPSDCDERARAVMQARFAEYAPTNLRQPIGLDAAFEQWPIAAAEAVLCINMVHISPWPATIGLFEGAASLLGETAPLIVYGPFLEEGVETAPSNLDFDRSLRDRDPRWGLRPREDLDRLADRAGFDPARRVDMPANNLLLVYRKHA